MKGFAKKLMLASSLVILTVVMLTYVFVLYFEANEEADYKDKIKLSFESATTFFETALFANKVALDQAISSHPLESINFFDEQNDPENTESQQQYAEGGYLGALLDDIESLGYAGAGTINLPDGYTYANVHFVKDGEFAEFNITSDKYRSFGEYIMFAGTGEFADCFFYGKKLDKETTGSNFFVLISTISPLAILSAYDADNYAISDTYGIVVDTLIKNSSIISFSKPTITGEKITFGGDEYLVFSGKIDKCFEDYSFVMLTDTATIRARIFDVSLKFYIFMAIASLFMLGFFVVFLALIRIDKVLSGTGEYRLNVDKAGNITSCDAWFCKRYKKLIGNVSDYLVQNFSPDFTVLAATTLSDEKAYLSCKKTQTKKQSYAFMASDVTPLYNDYLTFRLGHFTDDVTNMKNIQQLELDFEELVTERSKKAVCFIIYELGIEKFLAMYGVEFYKKLLKILADRISEVYATQARAYHLTSDRFVIMVENDAKTAQEKIDSAIEFIAMPTRVDELIVRTTCKAGYLFYLPSEETLRFPEIISRAELALSYAKSSGKKNHYGYVDSVMRSNQTLSNEDIRQIILANEIKVFFQPQYSLKKQCIVGFESLTRLSGKYSYINPGVFIENVEQTGAMVMLGDYIMDKSMKFASTLQQKDIKISVNVSPLQLLGEKFVEKFLLKLSSYNLQPSQIGIEITETYEMSSIAKAREKLRDIQKCGISVGIDDFGEKYSSLRYIKNLPIDFIKIDKGFVDDIETDRYSHAIVEMIVSLAKRLELYTTVEGVENLNQVRILEQMGADLIQGYIISAAADEETAREFIETKKNLFG